MKTIIFDFDGVLHDTFDIAYSVFVKVFDKDATKDDYRSSFEGNIYHKLQATEEQVEHFFDIQDSLYEKLIMDAKIKQFIENSAQVRSHHIVSSNNEKTLNDYLSRNDVEHHFDSVLGVETHRSKVTKFHHLFDNHDVVKEDAIFVTDTLGDILEAHKVGLKTIAIDTGFHGRERLERGSPYAIISDLADINHIVHKL